MILVLRVSVCSVWQGLLRASGALSLDGGS